MNNKQLLNFCEADLGVPVLGVCSETTFYGQMGWMGLSKSISEVIPWSFFFWIED